MSVSLVPRKINPTICDKFQGIRGRRNTSHLGWDEEVILDASGKIPWFLRKVATNWNKTDGFIYPQITTLRLLLFQAFSEASTATTATTLWENISILLVQHTITSQQPFTHHPWASAFHAASARLRSRETCRCDAVRRVFPATQSLRNEQIRAFRAKDTTGFFHSVLTKGEMSISPNLALLWCIALSLDRLRPRKLNRLSMWWNTNICPGGRSIILKICFSRGCEDQNWTKHCHETDLISPRFKMFYKSARHWICNLQDTLGPPEFAADYWAAWCWLEICWSPDRWPWIFSQANQLQIIS